MRNAQQMRCEALRETQSEAAANSSTGRLETCRQLRSGSRVPAGAPGLISLSVRQLAGMALSHAFECRLFCDNLRASLNMYLTCAVTMHQSAAISARRLQGMERALSAVRESLVTACVQQARCKAGGAHHLCHLHAARAGQPAQLRALPVHGVRAATTSRCAACALAGGILRRDRSLAVRRPASERLQPLNPGAPIPARLGLVSWQSDTRKSRALRVSQGVHWLWHAAQPKLLETRSPPPPSTNKPENFDADARMQRMQRMQLVMPQSVDTSRTPTSATVSTNVDLL